MESLNCSLDYFILFLEKSIRHFNIIRENYDEFQNEFEKIRSFVSSCGSSVLRQKFNFLLSSDDSPSRALSVPTPDDLNYQQMKAQLRSIKYLTLIVMHLSESNQIKSCSTIFKTRLECTRSPSPSLGVCLTS